MFCILKRFPFENIASGSTLLPQRLVTRLVTRPQYTTGLNINISRPLAPWASLSESLPAQLSNVLAQGIKLSHLIAIKVDFGLKFQLPIRTGGSYILPAPPQVLPTLGKRAMLNVEPCTICQYGSKSYYRVLTREGPVCY